MRRILLLFIVLLPFCCISFAQQPDSVFVNRGCLEFIYLTDTTPLVKKFYFEENMEVEVKAAAKATEYDREQWRSYPNSMFAYKDLEFNKNLDSVLLGNQLQQYIFFAPDRYIELEEPYDSIRNDRISQYSANCWKQYSIDSLNLALLFDGYSYITYNKYREDIRFNSYILPLKGDRYFIDSTTTLQPDVFQGSYDKLLSSRQRIFDVDTLSVNGMYGLYTLTGKEVIPAVYDSVMTDEMYVRAFRGKSVTIFDYMGNIVKDGIKRAYPYGYRYQVLDSSNRVYWIDREGNELEKASFGYMSVDDILYPLPFDIVLTPPKKRGLGKKKTYHWVYFEYSWDYEEQKKPVDFLEYLDRIDVYTNSGVMSLLEEWDKELFSSLKSYYNNDFSLYQLYKASAKELSNYKLEIHEIPLQFKNPLLVDGSLKFNRSGDYTSMDGYLVIAKHRGKYGVFDVRTPYNPLLPFTYSKIDGNNTYFTLHKNGLKCHYPLSQIPRYKELEPMSRFSFFIRFTLPDGRKGWLLKNGEEFLDSE